MGSGQLEVYINFIQYYVALKILTVALLKPERNNRFKYRSDCSQGLQCLQKKVIFLRTTPAKSKLIKIA